MSREKHPNSRWLKGAVRHDPKTLQSIYRKYYEASCWHKGARVSGTIKGTVAKNYAPARNACPSGPPKKPG